MIDNFTVIRNMLVFDSEDEFYHLQILKRKKEHPELGSNSMVVKTYYISSKEYLDLKREEIKALCKFHNARAYINLNRRSFEKMAFHVLKKVADQIMNKDFRSARKAYESVCGAYMNEKDKKWIVDIDSENEEDVIFAEIAVNESDPVGMKCIACLDTKNGYHLITSPFNKVDFELEYRNSDFEVPDIHKNNPTILYIS